MLLLKLTLILCCFSLRKSEEVQSDTQDDDPKRRFYPFGLENLQAVSWNEPIYNPPNTFSPNYPILAEITPINERGQQISNTFKGYIYPTSISQVYYPYYSVMCEYQPKRIDNNNDVDKDIKMLTQNHLQPMHEQLNDLAIKLKNLTDLFVEQLTTKEEVTTTPTPTKEQKSKKEKKTKKEEKPSIILSPKLTTSKEAIPQTSNYSTTSGVVTAQTNDKISKDKKKKIKSPTVKTGKNTVNVQSNVFQCEGLTCPDEAQSCKITEHATEPDYVDIVKTVFCLSGDGQVLLKKESTTQNPTKGSSLNNSRMLSKNEADNSDFFNMGMPDFQSDNINKNFESMENNFAEAMEQFNQQMKNTFGPQ